MQTLKLSELTETSIKQIARIFVRAASYDWVGNNDVVLTSEEQRMAGDITARLQRDRTSIMNEATIWGRAVYPLLMLAERENVRVWSQVPLRACYPHVELQGVADGVLGMSLSGDIEVPYLIVVEAKRGLESPDPRPQLYGQLLAAARLNWENEPQPVIALFGCYTIVESWTFVCAEVQHIDTDHPVMTLEFSREYTQKTEGETILRILKGIVEQCIVTTREVVAW